MKFKIVLLISIIICLTFCSCSTDTPTTTDSNNTSSASHVSSTNSNDKYGDIISFIEENDYYNAYNEFQKLTEEQRKKEYDPSDTQKELEKIEKRAYKEENYDEYVKKINITVKNFLNYFELYSDTRVTTDENDNKFAYMNYYIRLKEGYTLAKSAMGYNSKINLGFSYVEKGRYYTLASKTEKVTIGMYTANTTFSPSRRTMEYELDYSYSDWERTISSTNYNHVYKDDYGNYMMVCEDFIFTYAKGTLYLETD